MFNRVSTSANPGKKSPFEMLHSRSGPLTILIFLTVGAYKVLRRANKSQPGSALCFYLFDNSNDPGDSYKGAFAEWEMHLQGVHQSVPPKLAVFATTTGEGGGG